MRYQKEKFEIFAELTNSVFEALRIDWFCGLVGAAKSGHYSLFRFLDES